MELCNSSEENEPTTPPIKEFISYAELPHAQRRAIRLALGGNALGMALHKLAFDQQNIAYVDGRPLYPSADELDET